MPVYLPALPAVSGDLRFAWVDAGGTVRDLSRATSPDLFVTRGSRGLGAPPVELVLEKLPFTGGSVHRHTQTRPLEIDLPLYVRAASLNALAVKVGNLRSWFYTGDEQTRSLGYLRVTRPDDEVRQIGCVYAGGLEGDLSEGAPEWAPSVISLVAPDPYWTDADPTEHLYDASDLGDTLAVINPGDVDAYPVWTVGGPASSISITNASVGKSWALTASGGVALAEGDTLTVDTRPAGQRTTHQVTGDSGASLFDRIAHGGALWWLRPGQNNFVISAVGTSASTTFGLSFLPRYRGVLR